MIIDLKTKPFFQLFSSLLHFQKAEAAVTLHKIKKIAILALTPILNLTQTLLLTQA